MKKITIAATALAAASLAVVGGGPGAGAATPTTGVDATPKVLSVANLLSSKDVTAAKFGYDAAEGFRTDTEPQFAFSVCQSKDLRDITGGNTFYGDWEATAKSGGSAGYVLEAVTNATTDGPQTEAWKTLNGAYSKRACEGGTATARHAISMKNAKVATYTTKWSDGPAQVEAVIAVNDYDRFALVTIYPTKTTDVDTLIKSAVARLRS